MKTLTRIAAFALCLAMIFAILPQMTLAAHAEEVSGECGPNLTWTLDLETGVLTIEGSGPMDDDLYYGAWDNYRQFVKSVVLPEGLTSLGDFAFMDCTALTEVELPESLETIGKSAFRCCSSLTAVTIPASVTEIGKAAFVYCSSLEEINVAAENETYASVDGVVYNKEMTQLLQYPVGRAGACQIPEGVTEIWESAFEGCKGLTGISFPGTLTEIGWFTFYDCSGMTELSFAEGLKEIGSYAFGGCNNLSSIHLPQSLECIGFATFSGCPITRIELPNGLRSVSDYAFSGCTGLREVVLPQNLEHIGHGAFAGCISLTKINLPESLQEIWNYAFQGCAMTEVTIPAGVTQIAFNAFAECQSLTAIHVSEDNEAYSSLDGVLMSKKGDLIQYPAGKADTAYTTPASIQNIGDGAFMGCENLESVTISDSVRTIGNMAFGGCANLQELHLGNQLNKIGSMAFMNCSALTSVRVPANVKYIDDYAFGFNEIIDEYFGAHHVLNDGFILCGYVNSAAQAYAEEFGVPFAAVDRFVDVKEDDEFFNPVMWAVANGVTTGTDANHFSPERTVTRADAMVFFWAAKGRPEFTSTDKTFKDVKKKHWAYPAVMWAVENGITGGTDGNHFSPAQKCTRCEILQFFYAAEEKPACTISNPYTDVKAKQWYADSAIWAYEMGIEQGENGVFGAKTPCTRASVVSYLYRFCTRQLEN